MLRKNAENGNRKYVNDKENICWVGVVIDNLLKSSEIIKFSLNNILPPPPKKQPFCEGLPFVVVVGETKHGKRIKTPRIGKNVYKNLKNKINSFSQEIFFHWQCLAAARASMAWQIGGRHIHCFCRCCWLFLLLILVEKLLKGAKQVAIFLEIPRYKRNIFLNIIFLRPQQQQQHQWEQWLRRGIKLIFFSKKFKLWYKLNSDLTETRIYNSRNSKSKKNRKIGIFIKKCIQSHWGDIDDLKNWEAMWLNRKPVRLGN